MYVMYEQWLCQGGFTLETEYKRMQAMLGDEFEHWSDCFWKIQTYV